MVGRFGVFIFYKLNFSFVLDLFGGNLEKLIYGLVFFSGVFLGEIVYIVDFV